MTANNLLRTSYNATYGYVPFPNQQQRLSTCVRAGELGQSEQCRSELARNNNCLCQMTFGNSQMTYMTVRIHVELCNNVMFN